MNKKILLASNLSQYPNLLHGFTTRNFGTDHPAIGEALGKPGLKLLTLKQIHSNRVLVYQKGDELNAMQAEEGDALITREKNILIGVRTADCIPVLVYDPKKAVIAAIHAGWRGVVQGVVERTVKRLGIEFQCNPEDLMVAIGYSLCGKCFEIGPEVFAQFQEKFGEQLDFKSIDQSKYCLSLRQIVLVQLKKLGVAEERVEILPYCTRCHHDLLYSYRGGDHQNRMLAVIGIG